MKQYKKLPVVGYEGRYAIAENGIVYSLNYAQSGVERALATAKTFDGYVTVPLWDGKRRKHCRVHRLLAMAFIKNPTNKPCVNHKDGDKTNNKLSNLEWCTRSENMHHAYKVLGRRAPLSGRFNNHTSKAVIQYGIDGKLIAEHPSQSEAARKTGLRVQYINDSVKGRRKSAGGFIWKYASRFLGAIKGPEK